MSPERIAADLDDRFRMLTGGARGLLPRQQTLLASVDWSHDRLDDDERRVFRRLSVLSGAFPLAAAEVIAAAPGDIDPFEIFDVLSRLVDKSLLIVEDTPSADVRYRLLETMRQYGSDRAKAADELVVLRDAHADWWTAWMEALTPTVPTDENVDQISAAYENCRACARMADRAARGGGAPHPLPDRGVAVHRSLHRRGQPRRAGRACRRRRSGGGSGDPHVQLLRPPARRRAVRRRTSRRRGPGPQRGRRSRSCGPRPVPLHPVLQWHRPDTSRRAPRARRAGRQPVGAARSRRDHGGHPGPPWRSPSRRTLAGDVGAADEHQLERHQIAPADVDPRCPRPDRGLPGSRRRVARRRREARRSDRIGCRLRDWATLLRAGR